MVIAQVMKSIPAVVAVAMSKDRDEKRMIRRARHKLMGNHPEPRSRAGIVIPDSLSSTYEGQPFVLFDLIDSRPEQRIIAFGTEANIEVTIHSPLQYE